VGVDPLIEDTRGEFLRIKALGEFLPFRENVFDHVLFATSLDHFVDPNVALSAAVRVCKPDGEIDIWLGEKRGDTPKPVISPEWYRRLQKPPLAEDVFHMKRLKKEDFTLLVQNVGLTIAQTESHRMDEYRVNHFYRLRTGK
jgi:ubiquinone/menaquinone biosynthesis C-methylase UbiE